MYQNYTNLTRPYPVTQSLPAELMRIVPEFGFSLGARIAALGESTFGLHIEFQFRVRPDPAGQARGDVCRLRHPDSERVGRRNGRAGICGSRPRAGRLLRAG